MSALRAKLDPEVEEFVRAKVAEGEYSSVDEIVNDALLLFAESRKSAHEKLDWLRAAISEAEESGDPIPAEEAFEQLAAKHFGKGRSE